MFALLINPKSQLPTVVSTKSRYYAELKTAGYDEIMTGHKRKLEDKEQELLEELYPNGEYDLITD